MVAPESQAMPGEASLPALGLEVVEGVSRVGIAGVVAHRARPDSV